MMDSRNRYLWAIAGIGLALWSGCMSTDEEQDFSKYRNAGPPPVYYSSSSADSKPAAEVPAEEALPKSATLEDCLAYAALRNPGLEAAFNRWKAALERIPQVKSLPDPQFNYRYYIREIETRVGPMRQGFGLSQKFPWFGKLALQGDAASDEANAARQDYERTKLMLFYQVKDAYFEYYYLGQSLAILEENLGLVRHMEQVARTRYSTGQTTHADLIRAQVELGKLEDRLKSLQELRWPILAQLNSAMNRPPSAELSPPTQLPERETNFRDSKALAWLEESNPDLRRQDEIIALRQHRIALAKKEYFPDVTIGVDYIDVQHSSGGRHPSDDGQDAVAVMASVNLPIWWDKLKAGVNEARRQYQAAVLERQNTLNQLSSTLKLVLYRYHDAERKTNLYRDTLVPKALESVRTTETAFRAGQASFLEMIDTQRVLLEFQLAAQRARVDRAQRLAEMEMILGREIPEASLPDETTSRPAAE